MDLEFFFANDIKVCSLDYNQDNLPRGRSRIFLRADF